ncbi:MAG: hypothetical protein EPN91_06805 [Salinibacterium sp.]|nr:MAG: hypothetical protein EPN91_06805 [Salinibacterium sp.]
MAQKTLQTRLLDLLGRAATPLSAEVAAIHLEEDEAVVARELEALFAGSRVECARDRGVYRVVPRN